MTHHSTTRQIMAMGLAGLLVWTSLSAATADYVGRPPLSELVNEPYLLLLEKAPDLEFTKKEIEALKKDLKREEKAEKDRLKASRRIWRSSSRRSAKSWKISTRNDPGHRHHARRTKRSSLPDTVG